MSTHSFLFTYTVIPVNQSDKNISDTIRDRIADLDGKNGWIKLGNNIETAFKGEISLSSLVLKSKRDEAKQEITKILETVFDNDYRLIKVHVYVALLVDELHEVIEFSF